MAIETGLPAGQQLMAVLLVKDRADFLSLGSHVVSRSTGAVESGWSASLVWLRMRLGWQWLDTLVAAPGEVWY